MSDRLNELKSIGYNNLKGEEREEYRQLIAVAEGSVTAPIVSNPINEVKTIKSETVTMTQAEIDKLVADKVAQAKKYIPSGFVESGFVEVKPKEKAKPVATLRKWRKDSDSPEGLMVKAVHHSWVYDEDTRKHDKNLYKFTFLMPDNTEQEVIMPYIELIKMNDVEIVRIIEMEKKQFEKKQGWTRTKFVDKDGSVVEKDGFDKAERVEVVVKIDGYPTGALVECEDGRQIRVPVSCLNA